LCDVATIAGIALTGASTVANSIAQGQVNSARNDALAAERIRQGGLDREAQAINDTSRNRFENFDAQQSDKASELGQYFTDQKIENAGQNATATAEQTMPQSGSALTVREENKQRGEASAFTNKQGETLGKLRAFGDVLGEASRDQARDASLVGQLGGFKQGSSNVVPLELEAANQKGQGLKMFGDLLGLGGSIGLSKGLGGSYVGSTPTVSASAPTLFKAPVTPVSRAPLYNLYGAR
jgi:hypothetical protein